MKVASALSAGIASFSSPVEVRSLQELISIIDNNNATNQYFYENFDNNIDNNDNNDKINKINKIDNFDDIPFLYYNKNMIDNSNFS